ncbi:HD domain-containing phosphohydrolase [Dongia deserti]|uniref:HD domain-containing phosphohydrolase n=1 Tax=Dongia deserti TaxID=2268030 RepID=UPI000E6544AD|nr:HD domain-containing phosphohydrolase [Dongia deserti]
MFESGAPRRGFDLKILFPAIILIVLGVVGIWAINRFVDEERERELTQWQVRLGIVADSRAAEVNRWLAGNLADLNALADNESVQLYVGSIDEFSNDPEQREQVEGFRQYLRNLLLVAAMRGGFGEADQDTQPNFNQTRIGTGGILIINNDGAVVAASPDAPPFDGALRDFVTAVAPGASATGPLTVDSRGEATMTFVVPLFAVQSDQATSAQIGRIVGVKRVARALYPLLRQPGDTTRTATTVLLTKVGDKVAYLSPVRRPGETAEPLGLTMELSTPDLDAAYAVTVGNGFAAGNRDYSGRRVLVAARAISGAPWVLMHTVEYEEALGAADNRFRALTVMLGLALLVIAVAIIAVWRHGSSRRASEAASRAQLLAHQYEAQKDLLQLVTDSQPTSIFILDNQHRYRFANAQASKATGITPGEMLNKDIAAVLGPASAKRYLELNEQALKAGAAINNVARLETEGDRKVLQSEHIPLKERSGATAGVLTVEHDITDVVTEREKRARTLQNLVKTLVGVVDRRDPFAANHSTRVARVARAVAREMGLTETETDTAEIAANLLNLGKIMIPPEVLAKTGDLTEEERRLLRNSVQVSADMIQEIEFDGPVVETLRQAQERWDGSGQPRGLKGEETLITARIIAVANALVGMISDRAFRQGMSMDSAIEILFKEAGHAYDRRVVAALVNYLDNRDGRAQLADIAAAQ